MIVIPPHKLKVLRRDVHGDISKIAKQYDFPISSVHAVLKGIYYNQDIIDACIEYRDEMIKRRDAAIERI
jgi:hypothetical protein